MTIHELAMVNSNQFLLYIRKCTRTQMQWTRRSSEKLNLTFTVLSEVIYHYIIF